jgi:hypothetical protein
MTSFFFWGVCVRDDKDHLPDNRFGEKKDETTGMLKSRREMFERRFVLNSEVSIFFARRFQPKNVAQKYVFCSKTNFSGPKEMAMDQPRTH